MAYTPSPSIVMLRTSPGLVVIPLSNGTRPSLFEHKREERVKRRGRRGRPNVWVGVCGKDIKVLNKRPGSEVTRPRYVKTKKDTGLEDTKGCLPFFPSCQSFLPTKAWRQWGEREDIGPSLVSLICPPTWHVSPAGTDAITMQYLSAEGGEGTWTVFLLNRRARAQSRPQRCDLHSSPFSQT